MNSKMKNLRRVVLLVAMAFAAHDMAAQRVAGDWAVIPRVGVSLSKFTNDDFLTGANNGAERISSSYKEGFSVGADVEYLLHERVGISAGLYYMGMGSRYKDFQQEDEHSGTGYSNNRTTMGFLQLPVLANLYVGEGLALKVGVQVGRQLHSKTRTDEQEWTRDEDGHREYGDVVSHETTYDDAAKQKFYCGIPVGIAYEYENVILEARYIYSLTHPFKTAEYDRSHHSTFLFTVGYRFDIE